PGGRGEPADPHFLWPVPAPGAEAGRGRRREAPDACRPARGAAGRGAAPQRAHRGGARQAQGAPSEARRGRMRIVGGTLRGRSITGPQHEGLRPTADRVRESLFNILAHGVPELTLEGARVIDLFAGTGALGLEAISRGAAFCLFVDNEAEAR